ncbi:ATP synthase subunit b [bacterium BMS3Abin07]|nr:ATP synthase subunit b [bacterium BMS3Abin07]GBE32010.1 ATP synthase subunit b [bacterium BMS3Bbin05]HDL20184.1 ATP synthase F0 subunit B [Nitrospirota bacterium]HDO21412.1 ATP synthase F0 subunit B [Nitrospirota bacterium]HDZ87174.1 ATP synthase F0 subunit B [Nitrospirota bacterium]
MKRTFLTVIMLLFVLVLTVTAVYAAEGSAEHTPSVLGWVWKLLNFTILVVVLVWFLGKPVKSYLKQRTELIEKSIKEASDAKAAAEKALKEVEDKLKLKDQEIERIMDAAKKSGESDRDALLEEGKRMSERIKAQARVNIEQELKQAKDSLKADAARLAIEIAGKKIKEKLTHEDQIKILEESLKKIEEHNG